MPIGVIFAVVFIGGVWSLVGLSNALGAGSGDRVVGLLLVLLGLTLCVGLVRRARWARLAAIVASVGMAGAWLVGDRLMGTAESLFVIGSVLTALLLALPWTGESEARPERNAPMLGLSSGVLFLVAMTLLILPTLGDSSSGSDAVTITDAAGNKVALPASAISKKIDWHEEFTPALAVARDEERVMLVTFVTDWCGFCTKMRKTTWKSKAVAERVAELVPVRVDAEQEQELAVRYGVQGFPANFLIDGEGKVVSRADGYLTARQLLEWIDRSLGPRKAPAGSI